MKWGAIAVGLTAVAAFAAGCGGDGDDQGGATPAATDYASCLRANGVVLPTGGPDGRPSGGPNGVPSGRPSGRPSGAPGGGGFPSGAPGGPGGPGGFGSQAASGVDQETWEKAQQACAGLRPSAVPGNRRDNGAQTAYRNCLNDHGVTTTGRIEDLDTSDPKVADAMQACAALRPSGAPTPSSS